MARHKNLVVCALGTDELESFLAPQSLTPFHFSQYQCASVESFYHAMKVPETVKRREEVAASTDFRFLRLSFFPRDHYLAMGSRFEVGSLEHYCLIKEVTRSKLFAYRPQVLAFARTKGNIEISAKGNPSFIKDDFFDREMYRRILMELRRELYRKLSEIGLLEGKDNPITGHMVDKKPIVSCEGAYGTS